MKAQTLPLVLLISTTATGTAQFVVEAPAVEARQDQKNIFDTLKYAWEQGQWAEKLATLHNTLTTVQDQLKTANQVKQAIGDPVAAIGLIDNGLISDYLDDSGIADTLSDLTGIAQEGAALSGTIQEMFQPIDMSRWQDLASDASSTFDGVSSFRDSSDPLRQYRAVENAYSRFEVLLNQARSKRETLNRQIAKLTNQLKGAKDDAEVQKVAGSLTAAQTALADLDSMTDSANQQVEMLHVLNENRLREEQVAAEEISRNRNRELAQLAAQAEAEIELPSLDVEHSDFPPGF